MRSGPLVVASALGLALSAASERLLASGEVGFGLSYDARVPVGSFRNAIGDPSWQGFLGSFDYFPVDWMSIGVAGQYNLFQEGFGTQTTALPRGAITAEAFRYATIWSLYPVVRFYLAPLETLRPYFALGVGPVNVIQAVLTSDVYLRDDSWHLFVQPTAGVFLRLGPDPNYGLREDPAFGVTASVSYAFTTASLGDVSNLSYVGLQVGLYAKY